MLSGEAERHASAEALTSASLDAITAELSSIKDVHSNTKQEHSRALDAAMKHCSAEAQQHAAALAELHQELASQRAGAEVELAQTRAALLAAAEAEKMVQEETQKALRERCESAEGELRERIGQVRRVTVLKIVLRGVGLICTC
jgi:hypothetical protein